MFQVCCVNGCNNNKYYKSDYCYRHWRHITRHGKILARTRYDKNEIFCDNGVCRIFTYHPDGTKSGYGLIDFSDLEIVKKYKWHLDVGGYLVARKDNKLYRLHRLLLGLEVSKVGGIEGDHINGKTNDNRRVNLRVCTIRQNQFNRRMAINNTSGFKGVSWSNREHKWRAYITNNQKFVHLGTFNYAIEAARKYNEAAKNLAGVYARLNRISIKIGG